MPGTTITLLCFRTLVIWVNEEDHLRIISMEQGGDLGSVFRRQDFTVYDINMA
jgi:arginine kinase